MTHLLIHQNPQEIKTYLFELLDSKYGITIHSEEMLYTHPDYHLIESAGKQIGIDEVKALQDQMRFKPFQQQHQFAIIYDSHLMTTQAQNAMLKTLEEQSESAHYILTTHNEKALLETIISRSVKHYITNHTTSVASEKNTISPPLLLTSQLPEAFQEIERIYKESKEDPEIIARTVTELSTYLREQAKSQTTSGGIEKIEKLLQLEQRLHSNVNLQLALEATILSIREH